MNTLSTPNTTMVFSYDIKQAVTSPLSIMKKRSSHHVEGKAPNDTQKTMILPDPAAGETCDTHSHDGQTP